MKNVLLVLCVMTSLASAGQITQSIVGRVVDSESLFPLPGVTVQCLSCSPSQAVASDMNGDYEVTEVLVGRHRLVFSFVGYNDQVVENVMVNSARETVINVSMEEMVMQIQAAEITADEKGEVRNDMATVSARQFDVLETDRYAGSRGDPARMASNFAGVQGADDSRNDIVVRGNSPSGVLWRIEGVDIPNPNHFSIPGTGGGPVSIINNKMLSNSDFFTGAFPAEFGNSVSAVFDLRLRNGNRRSHEFSGQFGFLGTEILAEGPINKERGSSYLGTFRYSTLSMFSALGIDIGTSAVPEYSDGFFRVNLPQKNGSQLALWGIGGQSSVDILISDQVEPERNIFGENDRDQYFRTRMGIVGLTSSRALNKDLLIKNTLSVSHDWQNSHHELVYRHLDGDNKYVVDSLVDLLNYTFQQNRVSWSGLVNQKISRKLSVKAGVLADTYFWDYFDEVRDVNPASESFYAWDNRWNSRDEGLMLQSYAQVKFRPNDDWTFVGGLHNQYFTLNGSQSWLEPRLGARRVFADKSSISLGYGRHSQMQSTYLYFYQPGGVTPYGGRQFNRGMDFTRSDHYVLAYDRSLGKNMRMKVETYYQSLFDIPVEVQNSSFSLVNSGAGFARFFPDSLTNAGTGSNYGVEFTLEKFFSNSYFFMVTASLFDSKYVGSDGVERNTDFNGKYAFNALGSKEWIFNETNSLVTGVKFTMAGGRWYGPVDIEASNEAREVIFIDSLRNTLQFDDYLRFDVKVNYKINRPKVTHEIGLDLVNVTGRENVLKLTFAPDENNDPEKSIREEYQLGFLPVFFYRIDF